MDTSDPGGPPNIPADARALTMPRSLWGVGRRPHQALRHPDSLSVYSFATSQSNYYVPGRLRDGGGRATRWPHQRQR